MNWSVRLAALDASYRWGLTNPRILRDARAGSQSKGVGFQTTAPCKSRASEVFHPTRTQRALVNVSFRLRFAPNSRRAGKLPVLALCIFARLGHAPANLANCWAVGVSPAPGEWPGPPIEAGGSTRCSMGPSGADDGSGGRCGWSRRICEGVAVHDRQWVVLIGCVDVYFVAV